MGDPEDAKQEPSADDGDQQSPDQPDPSAAPDAGGDPDVMYQG